MNLKDWNRAQVEEALGEVNAYYYWQRYGRQGTHQELLLYYAQCGGASGFAKRNEKERPTLQEIKGLVKELKHKGEK